MTTTQTATTDTAYIGRCLFCKAGFRAIGGPCRQPAVWCDCRTNEGHPYSGIRWNVLKGRVGTKACNDKCLFSTTAICNCRCGGDHHGSGLRSA